MTPDTREMPSVYVCNGSVTGIHNPSPTPANVECPVPAAFATNDCARSA